MRVTEVDPLSYIDPGVNNKYLVSEALSIDTLATATTISTPIAASRLSISEIQLLVMFLPC